MTPDANRGEPLSRLLYRFLWPFQYFRDVTRGSRIERVQNYRYNRAMRAYLPGFVLKWALLTGLWFSAAGFADQVLCWVVPAACLYVTATWTLSVSVVLVVCWLWLERFPELY